MVSTKKESDCKDCAMFVDRSDILLSIIIKVKHLSIITNHITDPKEMLLTLRAKLIYNNLGQEEGITLNILQYVWQKALSINRNTNPITQKKYSINSFFMNHLL